MTKYATFSLDTGILTGRYDSEIHSNIPSGALVVPDYLWDYSIQYADRGYLILDAGDIMWEVPPPAPLPSEEELFQRVVATFDAAVESHLLAGAVAAGYSSIERACMYASAPNPFQAESQSFVEWVGAVWEYCYGELNKVSTGVRVMPTIEEVIAELPARVLPV